MTGESTATTIIPADDCLTTEFGKFITFEIEPIRPKAKVNSLEKIMAAVRELRALPKIDENDKKGEMYNEIVHTLTTNGGKWTAGSLSNGEKFAKLLTNILWIVSNLQIYVDILNTCAYRP